MFLIGRLRASSPQVISTMLIFSLATGVLGGLLFYFDSTRPIIMSEMMDEVDYHIQLSFTPKFYSENEVSYDSLISDIKTVDGVEEIEHVLRMDTFYHEYWFAVTYRYSIFGIHPSFFTSFEDCFHIESSSHPFTGNSCYVELSAFTAMGLSLNESLQALLLVKLSGFVYEIPTNFTVAGTFTTTIDWPDTTTGQGHPPLIRLLVPMDFLKDSFEDLTFKGDSSLRESIWVNLSAESLAQDNPQEAQKKLGQIKTSIEQRTVPYAIVSDYPVLNAILGYASWSSNLSVIAIAFSIPSVIMGIMLVKYNDDLLEDERRQEIGSIRVRGATGWQSFSWILSRGLVTAVLGSIAAFITSILAAVLSGSVKELLVFDIQELAEFPLIISLEAIIFIFSFSFLIGTFISLPSAVKSLLTPPVEAHRKMRDESLVQVEIMRSPTYDLLVIVASGLLSIILIPAFSTFSGGVFGVLLSLTTIVVFGAFALSSVRFLSASSGSIKEKLLNSIQNHKYIPSYRVLARTARFRCNSEAIGVIFISMVFVSAFFSTIAATTSSNHIRELVLFDYGAEIVVDVDTSLNESGLDLVEQVRNIDGVTEAAGLLEYALYVEYRITGPYATEIYKGRFPIIGVECPEWGLASFSLPYFTESAPLDESLQMMAENASFILSSFRPIVGFSINPDYSYETNYGKTVLLLSETGGFNQSLEIIDILSVDGAIDTETYLPGYPGLTNFLVVNINLLHEMVGTDGISKIVIETDEGSDHKAMISQISTLLGAKALSIASSQERLEEILTTRGSQSIFGIYTLNLLFSILYLTVGMIIVTYDKARGMSKQFSILRAIGTDIPSLTRAILSDAFVSICLSCIIGSIVAMTMILMVIHSPMIYIGSSLLSDWFLLPLTISFAFDKIFAFVAIGFVFPLVSTYLIARMKLRVSIADDLRGLE